MCVWCCDSVGKAVDVPTQRYSMYSHQIPIQHQVFPTYRIHTARQTPFHHLAQTHTYHTYPTSIPSNSTPESNLLQPTRPDHIKNAPYTIPQTDTPYPLPTRSTPTPQPDPTTPPYPPHPTLQTLTPPTPICPPLRKDSHQS